MIRNIAKTSAGMTVGLALTLGGSAVNAMSFAPVDPFISAQIDSGGFAQLQSRNLNLENFGGLDFWAIVDCPACFVGEKATPLDEEIWGAIDLGFYGG